MKTYRVIKSFDLEYEHTTVCFNVRTIWKFVGEHKGYQRLYRDNVFVDITRNNLREFFKEIEN